MQGIVVDIAVALGVYSKKNHKYSYVQDAACSLLNQEVEETLDKENDDDCVVFLPGDEDDLLFDGADSGRLG